jgi:hypothetical protein
LLHGSSVNAGAGDERLARFGYCASAVMRYGIVQVGPRLVDDALRGQLERSFGLPIEQLIDVFVEEQRYLMGVAEEARSLLRFVSASACRASPDALPVVLVSA